MLWSKSYICFWSSKIHWNQLILPTAFNRFGSNSLRLYHATGDWSTRIWYQTSRNTSLVRQGENNYWDLWHHILLTENANINCADQYCIMCTTVRKESQLSLHLPCWGCIQNGDSEPVSTARGSHSILSQQLISLYCQRRAKPTTTGWIWESDRSVSFLLPLLVPKSASWVLLYNSICYKAWVKWWTQ